MPRFYFHTHPPVAVYLLTTWLLLGASGWMQAQDLREIPKQKPFQLQGSLAIGASYYQAFGIPNRRQPFYWYLSGSPTISLFGIAFPFSITVSEQERRFSQPFNQYGVSPNYKWVKLHAGYRNVRFSDYTLAGASFLGGGIEINPGILRAGFVYGRFARAIDEDSTALDPRIRFIRPAYKRMGYGGKLGIGKANNYVDFLFFTAKDDILSITRPSLRSQVRPQENLTVGIKSQFSLLKKRLAFDIDLGASVLTRDSQLGNTVTPEVSAVKFLNGFVTLNNSTGWFTAGHVASTYTFGLGSVGLRYQRVDPDYQSLGAYYFQTDIQQITIDPSLNLFQGKLSVSGSYGLANDNLNGKQVATTNRVVSSASVSIMPDPSLNINLNYSNFGISQNRVRSVFDDSTAVSLVSASYGFSVTYSLYRKEESHSLSMYGNYQNTADQNRFTRAFSDAGSLSGSISYNYSYNPAGLALGTSVQYSSTQTGGRTIVTIGPNANASGRFLDKKLRVGLNLNCQFRQTDGASDGLTATTNVITGYTLGKQTVSLTGGYVVNRFREQKDGLAFRDFNEFRTSISYGIRFGR